LTGQTSIHAGYDVGCCSTRPGGNRVPLTCSNNNTSNNLVSSSTGNCCGTPTHRVDVSSAGYDFIFRHRRDPRQARLHHDISTGNLISRDDNGITDRFGIRTTVVCTSSTSDLAIPCHNVRNCAPFMDISAVDNTGTFCNYFACSSHNIISSTNGSRCSTSTRESRDGCTSSLDGHCNTFTGLSNTASTAFADGICGCCSAGNRT
jgi:hypothetical protein